MTVFCTKVPPKLRCFGVCVLAVAAAVATLIASLSHIATKAFADKSYDSALCYVDPQRKHDDFIYNATYLAEERAAAMRQNTTDRPHRVVMNCWITNVDLHYYAMKVSCRVGFWGMFAKAPSYTRLDLTRWHDLQRARAKQTNASNSCQLEVTERLKLVVEYSAHAHTTFSDGDAAEIKQFDVQLAVDQPNQKGTSRTTAEYPNFLLSLYLPMTAYIVDSSTPETAAPKLPQVPLSVVFDVNNMPMFKVQGLKCGLLTSKALVIVGYIAIDNLSAGLLVDLNVVMWLLAASALLASLWWVTAPRDARPPFDLLSFSGALLFALPTIRGLWPAAPPGSTRFDVLCIWPQLLLVSTSVLILLAKTILVTK